LLLTKTNNYLTISANDTSIKRRLVFEIVSLSFAGVDYIFR